MSVCGWDEQEIEAARQAALARYGVLDTPAEQGFDDLTRLAALLCEAPVALVTLLDRDRQWFKAKVGTEIAETPIEMSICARAVLESDRLVVVPDLSLDERFRMNPLVTGDPHLRFYAGARLEDPGGVPLGTLCVLNTEPRPGGLSPAQSEALRALARQVMSQLELRQAGRELRDVNAALAERAEQARGGREVAEQSAQRTERSFRLLVQGVTDYAIYMLDPQGRVSSWNAGAERIKGYTESEILGSHVSRFYTPEDLAAGTPARALGTATATGRFEAEGWRVRRDGTPFWASVVIDAIRGEDGALAGFAKITRDMSERREAQRALDEAREALAQAQKMEAVGQLTGGIAHDFNNLLTGIIGSLDLLQSRLNQGRNENLSRYIGSAMASANRAAALTHRLLAFARRQPLDPKPVDANRLVTSMEDLLRRTISESIRLEIVRAGGLWPTICDPNQLENAILNLVINARDAMPDGGALTIETCNTHLDHAYAATRPDVAAGQYVCISVTDTGTGMTPDVMARAFDPFFTTKPLGQGTGLGLSMIYGFARQSEGHASLYSEPGRGTTVKIYLPHVRGEVPGDPPKPLAADDHRSGRGETVLVVEDDAVVRDLIVEVLHDSGYRSLEARDGPAGLRIIATPQPIDLLVTDIGLPGLNGRQLADRARETRPDLKVLFITGYAENAPLAFLAPGMQMITKPFPVEALARRIRAIIED